VVPDSYRFAILFGAWLRPEELPRGAQMELRWDVARDYLNAGHRRGGALFGGDPTTSCRGGGDGDMTQNDTVMKATKCLHAC